MPFMKNGKRDYKREEEWQRQHGEVKKIAERVQARRDEIKKVGKAAVQGMDVDHIKPLDKGGDGALSNLRVVTPAANRSFKRDAKGNLVSQTSKKEAAAKRK